ncbi:MAG: GDP-mannose mannosyl hydrolase [Stagnimonas sp.]|nr:GDP-mannose mannosyl hydrolase [Stagnimonas sp.]
MSAAALLPRAEWLQVVRNAPLVSIDLILIDPQGRVLLGLRENEPARDCWFVPGGVIRKGESLDAAFSRIAETELGLPLRRQDAELLGVYEHFYQQNFAGAAGFGTHYVVLAHRLALAGALQPADAQHRALRWFRVDELLAEPAVHANVKAYFR